MPISTFRYASISTGGSISVPVQIMPDVFPINSGSASSSGTTATIPSNALVFLSMAATGANDSFTSVVDSVGNHYNVNVSTSDGSNGAQAIIWLVTTSSIPSGTTYTAVTSDGSQWGIGEGWYASGAVGGLDTQHGIDNDVSNGTTSISLSTGSLAESVEIIIGAFNTNGNAVTWTESSGFTTLHNDTFSITSYQIVSSSSSVTWNPTFTATGPCNAVLASFKSV